MILAATTPVNVFNTTKVPHWFPDMRELKVLLHPSKKWIFGPETCKFGPKLTLFFGQILAFLAHLITYPTKNNADKLLPKHK